GRGRLAYDDQRDERRDPERDGRQERQRAPKPAVADKRKRGRQRPECDHGIPRNSIRCSEGARRRPTITPRWRLLARASGRLLGSPSGCRRESELMTEQRDAVAETAAVHATVELEPGVTIGARPRVWRNTHIRTGAAIGADCNIGANVFVDRDVRIGDRAK